MKGTVNRPAASAATASTRLADDSIDTLSMKFYQSLVGLATEHWVLVFPTKLATGEQLRIKSNYIVRGDSCSGT